MMSLQSYLKCWHVVYWCIFSIDQINKCIQLCTQRWRASLFVLRPSSRSSLDSSSHTQPNPLYWASEVHDPSTEKIYCKHKDCVFLVWFCGQASSEFFEFTSNHTWHSLWSCLTLSYGSHVILLNSLSLRAFQRYQIIHGKGSLSNFGSSISFFLQKK